MPWTQAEVKLIVIANPNFVLWYKYEVVPGPQSSSWYSDSPDFVISLSKEVLTLRKYLLCKLFKLPELFKLLPEPE